MMIARKMTLFWKIIISEYDNVSLSSSLFFLVVCVYIYIFDESGHNKFEKPLKV